MGGTVNVVAKSQATPTPTATPLSTPTATRTATAAAPPAATTTPAPPKTGNGNLVGDGDAPYVAVMLAGFGLALLAGVRVATGRRAK